MADLSPTEVVELLRAVQREGGFDAALQDALTVLDVTKGKTLPKEQKRVADVLLKILPKKLQDELRRDIASGNQGVALTKIQANKDILEMRLASAERMEQLKSARQTERLQTQGEQTRATAAAATEQAAARGTARTAEAVAKAEGLGQVEIALEQQRAELAKPIVDPQVQTYIDTQEAELRTIINDKTKPLPPEATLKTRLDSMEIADTNGKQKADLLRSELQLRREEARTLSEVALRKKAPTAFENPGARQIALEEAATTGQKLPPKRVRILEEASLAENRQVRLLQEQGLQAKATGGGVTFEEGPKKRLFPNQNEEFARLVEKSETLRKAGQTAEAEALITKGVPGVKRGAFLKKAGIGGLLAALILPSLLGRKGGQEQQLNPMMQLQLAQQLSQLQNQGALTQSLVGARGSQAGLNEAKANLLRLQALQAAGVTGGSGLV